MISEFKAYPMSVRHPCQEIMQVLVDHTNG